MKEEGEEDYRKDNICRFCEKEILSDKVRDHCHLTGKHKGPAHSKCNINVTQDKSNCIPFIFHIFSKIDCHMFFKRLVVVKNEKIKTKITPKTNQENFLVSYGCIRLIVSYRILSSSLDKLDKNLDKVDFVILKKEFPDKWQYLIEKTPYSFDYFNNIDDYKKPVNNLKKEDFFNKLKNECPDVNKIERIKEINKVFDIQNGEELTKLYIKSDVVFLTDVSEKFVKVSTKDYGINPLFCISLSGYTYQYALKNTDVKI